MAKPYKKRRRHGKKKSRKVKKAKGSILTDDGYEACNRGIVKYRGEDRETAERICAGVKSKYQSRHGG